jgi:AcrR family transcriptional regulator
MPRVSEAHLAARRQQILDAARTCFQRNGFHMTSMQDVIAEAGLSVGAVYRYFRSKNELIAAIAEEYSGEISSRLGELIADPHRPMAEVMDTAIDLVNANTGPDGMMRLALQVWSEAMRDDVLAVTAEQIYTTMRGNFIRLARRATETGELPPDTDPEATGGALFSLVVGFALQRMLSGQPDPALYKRGVRTLVE